MTEGQAAMSADDRYRPDVPPNFSPLPPLYTSTGLHYHNTGFVPIDASWRSPVSTADSFDFDFDVGPDGDLDLRDPNAWLNPLSPIETSTPDMAGVGGSYTHSGVSPAILGLSLGSGDDLDLASIAGSESLLDDGARDVDMTTAWTPLTESPFQLEEETRAPTTFSDTSSFSVASSAPTSAATASSHPAVPSLTFTSFPDIPVRRSHTWHDEFLSTYPDDSSALSNSNATGGSSSVPHRTLSLKRRRSARKRTGNTTATTAIPEIWCRCIKPDRPKRGQQKRLDHLPTEILLVIFEYAYLTPDKPKGCVHEQEKEMISSRMAAGVFTRRATTGSVNSSALGSWMTPSSSSVPAALNSASSSAPPPADPASPSVAAAAPTTDPDEPDVKTEELRVYRAKTLLNIMLTCRLFHRILASDPGTDEKFWRTAARWCWEWLPERLADIQGHYRASQTSWRNLVAVFMRSENGLFGKKNGGKGGVESFGGRREGKDALTWREFQRLRENGKRRKLVLVCAQPGPDVFAALPKEDGTGWVLSLSIRGQPSQNALVHLNTNGEFASTVSGLHPKLKRNPRCPDYYQPDIFGVEDDRMRLVKVTHNGGGSPTSSLLPLGGSIVAEWDLSVINEMVVDPKARAARAVSHHSRLICNLYTHGARDTTGLELLLDPPETPTLFCLEASSTAMPTATMSFAQLRLGKQPTPSTALIWRRDFTHPLAHTYPATQSLHPVICNLLLAPTHAVALVRWNITSPESSEEMVDRAFHILSPATGATVRILEFPHMYWDYRHFDMSPEYNNLRLKKLQRMFNHLPPGTGAMGAGNRATRVHGDRFLLTPDGRIVSGSHDYCMWLWEKEGKGAVSGDENEETSRREGKQKAVYTSTRNDAGKYDEFEVLDDYYWAKQVAGEEDDEEDEEEGAIMSMAEPASEDATVKHDLSSVSSPSSSMTQSQKQQKTWTSNSERAGWWVRTPNQVLCFWHNIALSLKSANSTDTSSPTFFSTCRPGKLFIWELPSSSSPSSGPSSRSSANDNIQGFQYAPGNKTRWMGKLAQRAEGLRSRLARWFVWGGVIPRQGLWLVFEERNEAEEVGAGAREYQDVRNDHDNETPNKRELTAVYIDREELLQVTGVGGRWEFNKRDFVIDDDEIYDQPLGKEAGGIGLESDSDMAAVDDSDETDTDTDTDSDSDLEPIPLSAPHLNLSLHRHDSDERHHNPLQHGPNPLRPEAVVTVPADRERRKRRRVSSSASVGHWEPEVAGSWSFAAEKESAYDLGVG